MFQVLDSSGYPVDPLLFHRTGRIAEQRANRTLNDPPRPAPALPSMPRRTWRGEGYTVGNARDAKAHVERQRIEWRDIFAGGYKSVGDTGWRARPPLPPPYAPMPSSTAYEESCARRTQEMRRQYGVSTASDAPYLRKIKADYAQRLREGRQ